ncbi:hypothetical protein Nepgr_022576 [Nepenthes gracilis]|uniref:Uncharacterized protein n=1 Tax=Nepenthes gracilis TaxID=150966 RepID=A0AAD3T174_NEPGR|nr:hypothetical protein Nepgr_022576 [Nepenthes gracilis]
MGGGGNIGAVLIQVIFFKGSKFSTEMGITYMGMMAIVCTLPIALIYFPQWGGMIRGPKPNYTEQDYYLSEWTEEEQQQGFHETSMKFAENSKREGVERSTLFSPPLK